MQKWNFNPQQGDNAVSEGDEVVFYIDDLNAEVVAKVVEIQNQAIEIGADFVEQVDKYLADEERCTQEEREFVVEQIQNYVKLTQTPDEQVDAAQPQQPSQQGPAASNDAITPTPQPQQPQADKQQTPPPPPQGDGGKPGEQPPKRVINRRQAPQTNAGATVKGGSPADIKKQLQQKIELITLFEGVAIIDIPSGLEKSARDLLQEFQKEQQELSAKYMDRILKM